jgi:hypothetical protein
MPWALAVVSALASMMFSDLPSPAEAGFAKVGNRSPFFGIMLHRDMRTRP